jgi:hypothetical protein
MRISPSRRHLLTYALDFHNKQTALSCNVHRPITATANVTTNSIAASCRCTTASRAGALISWQWLTFPIGQNLPYGGFHEPSKYRALRGLGCTVPLLTLQQRRKGRLDEWWRSNAYSHQGVHVLSSPQHVCRGLPMEIDA